MTHTKKQLFLGCLILAASALCLPAFAQDVPPYLASQGRLFDSANAPLSGTQSVTFSLYDSEDPAATALWTETQTVLLADGYYSVVLGQTNTLDVSQFTGAQLFLGVAVGADPELAPRLPVNSVAYAIKSGVAQNVTGDITPSSITIGGTNGTVIDASGVSVGGNVIIDSSGAWSGPAPTVSFNDLLDRPFTFDDLSCTDGQIPQVVGGVWTCTPASAADTLSGLGCTEGQIPAFVGGVWTCATDADTNTTYAPGTGITISGANNDISVDTNAVQARVGGSCAAGLSIRQINADGTVICEDDTDTNTTYAAGAGITITGATNDIAVDTTAIQGRISGTCAANESIRQINADGTVLCETDSDTTYSAAAGGGLVLGGGNAFGIGADAITSARIADGAVGTLDLADNSVTSAKIADGTVGAVDLANASVTTVKLADANVTTAKIADASVTALKLADASVTTAKIADANVTLVKLADNSVNSLKIVDGSVALADLGAGSVDSSKIVDGAVGTADIANASITNVKMANDSVLSANILNGSIVAADVNTAEIQRRVTGTCPAGSFVSAVDAAGAVTCTNTAANATNAGSAVNATNAASLTCPAGWTAAAGGRLCQDRTVRNGTIHTAIATCTGLQARVCTHNDMQQLCGIGGYNPYQGAAAAGWYGDHAKFEPTGNTDDEYLTWNRNTCDPNNDGPAFDSVSLLDFFCCQ